MIRVVFDIDIVVSAPLTSRLRRPAFVSLTLADFLITGNTRQFPKGWKGTRIVASREFLEFIIQALSPND